MILVCRHLVIPLFVNNPTAELSAYSDQYFFAVAPFLFASWSPGFVSFGCSKHGKQHCSIFCLFNWIGCSNRSHCNFVQTDWIYRDLLCNTSGIDRSKSVLNSHIQNNDAQKYFLSTVWKIIKTKIGKYRNLLGSLTGRLRKLRIPGQNNSPI